MFQCLSYKTCPKGESLNGSTNVSRNSVVFMGCFNGDLIILQLLQPKVGVIRRKHLDAISVFYWNVSLLV